MRRAPAVDLVVGPQAYHKLPELIARAARATGERLETSFEAVEKFDALPSLRAPDGPSAFLSVQEGCDKFCTFCVVPYTRGAEYSRAVDPIILEARGLARQGVREITLLGQNVNAYHGQGPTLAGSDTWSLARLVRHLANIGGIERIRYTTSHPCDMDDDLIELLRTQESLVQTEPVRLFKLGEKIRLTQAPFAGIEGIYQMADGERRVMVLIEILSKPVAVRVAPASLRKAS